MVFESYVIVFLLGWIVHEYTTQKNLSRVFKYAKGIVFKKPDKDSDDDITFEE